jgi:hypothetical protein
MVQIPQQGKCGKQTCPTPPVSDAEDIETYCPSWLQGVRTSTIGKLLLKVGASCMYTLKSKCTGFLRYDATTEQVTVDGNPPFVSDTPQTTSWGFIAKVVNRAHLLCRDGQNDCPMEVRQELAAQLVEQVQEGQLAVLVKPPCGAVPLSDSADLDKQYGVHALDPDERKGCEPALILARVGNEWQLMSQLKFPVSQIGRVTPAELVGARPPLFVRVGGTDENPCYSLKVNDRQANNELPANAGNCEIAVFNSESGAWEAKRRGYSHYEIKPSLENDGTLPTWDFQRSVNMASAVDVPLTDIPQPICTDGKVFVELELWLQLLDGPSNSATVGRITIDGQSMVSTNSGLTRRVWRTVRLDVTGKTTISVRIHRTAGSGDIAGSLKILGYLA